MSSFSNAFSFARRNASSKNQQLLLLLLCTFKYLTIFTSALKCIKMYGSLQFFQFSINSFELFLDNINALTAKERMSNYEDCKLVLLKKAQLLFIMTIILP